MIVIVIMSAITNLAQQLKKAGYKLTSPRRAVIEALETHGDHVSHDQISIEGPKIYPQLSRATVYRTLELLVALKLVRPLYLNEPTQGFISGLGGHHHLVCTNRDAVIEFEQCKVEALARELAEKYNFQIRSHLLEFQGLCKACRQ